MSDHIPHFDSSSTSADGHAGGPLLSDFANDPDMLELVEMFVVEMPNRVSAIETAVNEADMASIASFAHQLKGAAGGYGFGSITDAAAVVERQAKVYEQLDEVQGAIDQLLSLCRRASSATSG